MTKRKRSAPRPATRPIYYSHTCAVCRRKFESHRSDAVTCSPACRMRRYRRAHA